MKFLDHQIWVLIPHRQELGRYGLLQELEESAPEDLDLVSHHPFSILGDELERSPHRCNVGADTALMLPGSLQSMAVGSVIHRIGGGEAERPIVP